MSLRSWIITAAACVLAMQAAALDISNRYRSPRNPERKVRTATTLIILHTTEAPARSSLNKVSDRGECHFCVTEEGSIYAIVDRDREAFHAGRSMWGGKEDVDKYSVGIECVGYHDKPMSMIQLKAIAALVKDLQQMYNIPDHGVIAHSHVAYGAPNKWQKRKHRGRKRCGMLFATRTIRQILALKSRPAVDVDVRAGRLAVGDPYLEQVLYSNVDFLAKNYNVKASAQPQPPRAIASSTPPKGQTAPKGRDSQRGRDIPVASNKKPPTAVTASPTPHKSISSTPPKSVAELKAKGYVVKGTISAKNTAAKIVGAKWNAADTYYTIRDKVFSGKTVNPAKLEKGMTVWRKK